MEIGRESFRVWALRGGGRPRINLNTLVESLSWDDVMALTTGQLQIREPAYARGYLDLGEGHRILLQVQTAPGAAWKNWWVMRINHPNSSLVDGTRTFQLQNDIALLMASRDDWKFVKGKQKPKGWLAHEITQEVCERYGVTIAQMPAGTHRIKNLVRLNTSPWDVIVKAWKMERIATNKRYFVDFSLGALRISKLRRASSLLLLGPLLVQASLDAQLKSTFATAATVRGRVHEPKGKDKKAHTKKRQRKIAVQVRSPRAIARYGYIHRILYDPDADSDGEARAQGLRYLARQAKPEKSATITHPGIPGVKRGDAVRVQLPAPSFDKVIWVKSAHWTLGPGEFTMELELNFDDPFVTIRKEKILEVLDGTALENDRLPPSKGSKKNEQAKITKRKRKTIVRPPKTKSKPKPVVAKSAATQPPSIGGVFTPL